THHAVPPTPGPLGAAGIFGVGIGEMILWGLVLTIPSLIAVTLYAKVMGPKIEAMIERDTGEVLTPKAAFDEFSALAEERMKTLPSLTVAMAPILMPIILIFANTGISGMNTAMPETLPAWLVSTASFVGNPVIAVGLGLLLAIYGLTRGQKRGDTLAEMEKGVESAGIILL
ncbi:GntT/GntP/DsdX family permease, partial [Leucobacter sp. M11]|uniref:GntT/GntP/DsdX family permease n=1 Tax=Leucobacter sp. M11 TaxID=2993565 RepID=UPI002D8DF3DC|nr:GntP family permease [Leucobacter sp. M11]